jgi:serine/threonine protein kinase/WD40 repeat protein/tetratricopeptide (TPR) repeat protein
MPSSDSSRDALLTQLAEEFVERHRRGERPALSEYVNRYPDLAAEVRDLFPALVQIEDLKPAAGDLTGAFVSANSPSDEQAPERFGEYRILRQVGQGGMGIVYEAEQESLGRHVALKVLPRQALLKTTYRERFRREAKAAGRLHHTNIVPVYGVGECDGTHYYAMQFISGEGLDKVLRDLRRLRESPVDATAAAPLFEGSVAQSLLSGRLLAPEIPAKEESPAPLAPSAPTTAGGMHGSSTLSAGGQEGPYYRGIARIGLQVADALAYAHRQGILHRDIKPSNLLLDQQGTVWVTDFGLAKAEGADDLTQTGDIVGTVRFMAPERFDGRSLPQSDVYALGVTLHELLTLRPAFDDAKRARLVEKVLHEPPTLPRKLDPRIPRDLETVVLKCIAKEPAERYATPDELADDLRRFLADRPIKARRASDAERLWRWCRRNPAVATLLTAVGLLLTITAVGGTILSWRLGLALGQARDAEREGKRKLFESYISEADAMRRSGRAGQRFGTLRRIHDALEISEEIGGLGDEDKLRLRNIAIAALCQPDVEVGLEWPAGPDQPLPTQLDPALRVRALAGYALDHLPEPAHMLRGLSWYSPDGCFVAAATQPYIEGKRTAVPARVWRIDGSRPYAVLDDPDGPYEQATAFRPDSRQVAFGHMDGTVSVYDTGTGKQLHRLKAAPGVISMVAFHPRLPQLAAVNDSEVFIWDTGTGRLLRRLRPSGGAGSLAWHPRGHRLAIGGNSNIQLWDVERGQLVTEPWRLYNSGGLVVAFNHAGDVVASTDWGKGLRLWDAATGRQLLTAFPNVVELHFGADDRSLGLRHVGDNYQILRVAGGQELRVLHRPTPQGAQRFDTFAVHPDGRLLVVTTRAGLGFFDLFSGKEVQFVAGNFRDVRGFDQTGALWTAGGAGLLRWPVQSSDGAAHRLRIGPPEWVANMAGPAWGAQFSADGRVAAVPLFNEGALVVHRGAARRVVRLGPQYDVRGVPVSPDGRWVATSTFWLDGSGVAVKVWEADTGKLVASLPYPEVTGCIGFSADSRWLYLTGKEDHRLEMASLTANPILTASPAASGRPPGQGRWNSTAEKRRGTFSPDNRVRANETGEGAIRLVSQETDQEIALLPSPEIGHGFSPASFSPDGSRLLAVGGETGSLYVFDLLRIRAQLAELGLDWAEIQPTLPPRSGDDNPALAPPLQVELIDAEWATSHEKMSRYETERVTARLFANPFDADAHYRLGGLQVEAGRNADAYAHLTAALAFRPDLDSAYNLRAEAALRLRRWDDAVADATHYLEKHPYAVYGRWLRVQANRGRKHHSEAAADLTIVLTVEPQNALLYEQRAECYEALGQTEKAKADRDKALKLGATNPTRLNEEAWGLVKAPRGQRDPARALELVQKALEWEPDNAIFLNTLGVAQYRGGQYAAAVLTLEKSLAASQGRTDGFDLFFLSMCHARLGEAARAKDYFNRAVKWTEAQKNLAPLWAEELKTFRAEAEAELRPLK